MSHDVGRRVLLKAAGVAAAFPGLALAGTGAATKSSSETLAAALWKSLRPEQKKVVAFPFDHALRSKVDNNWEITEPIAEVFDKDQQAMLRDIYRGIHSPEYADRVWKATVHDQQGDGFEKGCSAALFGEPGQGKFEVVITGRHVTRRCDGDSVAGAAFGGPIFYGHQAGSDDEERPDHPGNAYWFQAVRANEVWKALDGKQREQALLGAPRGERGTETVTLTGKRRGLPGIPLAALSHDQKDLVRKVLGDLLAPFRKVDADEALKLVETQGLDNLHMAFFKGRDLGGDGVWDVWQIEGPSMLWFFRGAPHIHVWAHIRQASTITSG
jgi:hypothetical protein